MRYVLQEGYRLRGYAKLPTGLFSTRSNKTSFYPQELYQVLLRCDGAHDLTPENLGEGSRRFLQELEESGVIRPARLGETLLPEQAYRRFPAPYRSDCHWSITGGCNFRCLHCFMSAPHAKHAEPSWEQLMDIADQLAECGVLRVGITGGEPLVRGDFLPLLDELKKRDIAVTTIYTNGWLVDEALLDALEARRMRPAFQLSFDGVGQHDFLRGVQGSERRAVHAFRLLQQRGYQVSTSMCLHKRNVGTIRETVTLLSSLGVTSLKVSPMLELGEWTSPETQELSLTQEEVQEAFCTYIPQYFEDDAPVDIMLGGSFSFHKDDGCWEIYNVRRVPAQMEADAPSCGVLLHSFYISAEGRVAPCMGMDDCDYASNFPNLFERPLREILSDPAFAQLECATVKQVRDANPECRECAHVDRCAGGCRNSALIKGDDYLGIDSDLCWFFNNEWDKKIADVAEPAWRSYLIRHPELEEHAESMADQTTMPEFC